MNHNLPDLFENVNDVDAATAARRFRRMELLPESVVLRGGTTGSSVIGLIRGSLEVRAGSTVLARIAPGELVGELALFEAVLRTADVVAAEPSAIVEISRQDYEELRDTEHPVAANLERAAMRQQARRLREMDDRITELAHGSIRAARYPGQDFFSQVAAAFGRGGLFDPVGVDRVSTLLASGLVSDVSDPVLRKLADRLEVQVCGAGQLLCTEGTAADRLWLIDEGEVEVLAATGEDAVHRLATVGPGTLLGAAALVDRGVRMASCVAKTRTVALSLDQADFDALALDPSLVGSGLRRAIIRALGQQLSGANHMLQEFQQEQRQASLDHARARMVAADAA